MSAMNKPNKHMDENNRDEWTIAKQVLVKRDGEDGVVSLNRLQVGDVIVDVNIKPRRSMKP